MLLQNLAILNATFVGFHCLFFIEVDFSPPLFLEIVSKKHLLPPNQILQPLIRSFAEYDEAMAFDIRCSMFRDFSLQPCPPRPLLLQTSQPKPLMKAVYPIIILAGALASLAP